MNYNLRSQNYNYFVRYKDGIPYIYYGLFQSNPSNNCNIDLHFICYDFYYDKIYYNTNWTPDHCDSGYTHIIQAPVNSYLYPQARNPPSGSYNLLCGNNYDIRVSNKIKITIPDDPVFSGIYVFDYAPGYGEAGLFSPDWVLNTGESKHNLIPYNHPDSSVHGKLLVSLSDSSLSDSVFGYPGYMEIKTSYYADDNNAGARELEDVLAFPAEFIFTAVQPPCPCNGIPDIDYIETTGVGHRVTVALAAPIRWRHPYRDWILVDKVSHTINNSITNYATGTIFNDGTIYVNRGLYLPNSKYIKHTKSYVPGTDNTVIGDGYISLAYNYQKLTSITCTGIPDLGIAFRSYGYGLGIDRGQDNYFDTTANIQGIGGFQEFSRNLNDNLDMVIKDERPFFDNKIPIKASVDFIYSCRPGLPCFNLTPSIISPTTGTGVGCITDYYTAINIDYLCGEYDGKPDDTYWINNNITSTNIVYSGISGLLPTVYQYGGGEWTDNFIYEAYVTNNENPIISIPYTGYSKPSAVRNWINSKLRLVSFDKDINNNFNINSISSTNPVVDLYWNINGNSATAYIVPSDEDIYSNITPELMLINAGTWNVNGKYRWDRYNNEFSQISPYHGFSIRLSYDFNDTANNTFGWTVGRSEGNTWVPYYVSSGYLNIRDTQNSSMNWYIPNNCYSGLHPPPNAFNFAVRNRFLYVTNASPPVGEPTLTFNTYYYHDEQTGFWISIENPNVQIRFIESNYFMGIVINGIYNIYYILYNSYSQFLGSELIYFSNRVGNILSLNGDAHPNCIPDLNPPEIITINPYPIGTGLATLRFWRNIYSTCESASGTNVTNQTITISCASGSININNETIDAGFSKIYNTIPFDQEKGVVITSSAGTENLIFIQGLTVNAAFSGNVILDWNNNRDHDLYGQITVPVNAQSNKGYPVGQWRSNGYYLGIGNPSSNMEILSSLALQ